MIKWNLAYWIIVKMIWFQVLVRDSSAHVGVECRANGRSASFFIPIWKYRSCLAESLAAKKKKKYLFEDNLASDLSANSALSDKKRQEYTPTWNKSFLYLFHTNFMVIHFRILNSTSVRVTIAAVKSHENKMPSNVSYLFATCCPSINSHSFGLITLVVFFISKNYSYFYWR